MINKIEETSGNYNSLFSFTHYNRLQIALLGIVLGLLYVSYTLYRNIEVYESPITGKKYLLLITKEKEKVLSQTLAKCFETQLKKSAFKEG